MGWPSSPGLTVSSSNNPLGKLNSVKLRSRLARRVSRLLRNNSGSLAMFAAIRRAPSRVSSLAADASGT